MIPGVEGKELKMSSQVSEKGLLRLTSGSDGGGRVFQLDSDGNSCSCLGDKL